MRDYEDKKKANVYELWTRPTIAWEYDCEETPSEVLSLMDDLPLPQSSFDLAASAVML